MNQTVRKLRFLEYWRIGEQESWFTDMAAEGLHLKKVGPFFAHFDKGEPKQMKYRLEVGVNKKITPEQVQMYKENGWDYVTTVHVFHVFSSPIERNAPELPIDTDTQSLGLGKLGKKLAIDCSIVAVALIITISLLYYIGFDDGTPTLYLVKGMVFQQSILTIYVGYLTYTTLQATKSIRALRNNLIEGKSIVHYTPWKKRHRLNSILNTLLITVVGLGSIVPIVQLIKSDTQTLPEESSTLPIVRLADVEQNPALIREEPTYIRDNVEWENKYTYDWSPFAPVQYDTDENGLIPVETWENGNNEYSPSLHTNVYQLTVPALADNLVNDLVSRYLYEVRDEQIVEINHPQFDRLIVYEEENRKRVFASKDKAVMYVRYHGHADRKLLLDNIAKKMHLISE
ncbi:DUF2812 domain-containing protein [Bacillus solimangrovi]|uniref:DUF2812 domain-containing protein n=1 Tax=Bacillus solimangrovi TaxID=1305675 RepID=A0A1E5LCH4_9BACI|nr:DUF2812 domain-containing protein [Bacillus solimangrovi]OEH91761.1 hypothetical protein BFG57_17700 [Bacillus solimangrovi]